jgi:cytoskeletal protein CcmA (bactofilin family)
MARSRLRSDKEEGELNTILGKGSSFEGSLDIEGDTRIDGSIKGKVKASDVMTIGPSGRVEAEVTVKSLVLAGKLVGRVVASDKVELQAKSIMMGDITTKSLTIEAGAIFHGNCNMSGEEAKRTPVRSKIDTDE